VGLARDLSQSWDVAGLLGRADAKDWGLPPVALSGKLLVLGSLGRDTAWQRDVLEYGILLSDGHVDLNIGYLVLGSLLLGGHLLLESINVVLEDALCLLWVITSSLD
jgi:hypothetical protein